MTDIPPAFSRTLRPAFAVFFSVMFLAMPGAASAQSRQTIVIDPGHGGFDRGGVPGQRISEKDKTLDVAQRLRQILQDEGYRVILTRDSDVFVSLPERMAIANSHRGATFVSIHFNCAPRLGANGIETYYYRRDSASLAASIHRNVVAAAPTENRGIRRRGFFVLRKTAIPSVLVECGFLTNPTEGRLVQAGSYRQQLARAIARGIQREPASIRRALAADAAVSTEVLPQPFNGGDFVQAAPASYRARSSTASRRKKSTTSRHRSTSRKKKKTSSDRESSSSSTKSRKHSSSEG